MKFYDLTLEEQADELDTVYWDLQNVVHEMESDNPFYVEVLDLMNRIHDEKKKTEEKMPKDNTNEYLKAEYWRNQL